MQSVVTAAVLADLLFDEFDGKDQNPFRPKEAGCQRGQTNQKQRSTPRAAMGPYQQRQK